MMVRVISAETVFITSSLKFHHLAGSTDLFNLIQSATKQESPDTCFTVAFFTHWGKFLSSNLISPSSKYLRHSPEGYGMTLVDYKKIK